MKAKIEVELKEFNVPNFAVPKEREGEEFKSVPLSSLDSETLEKMCENFTDAVFKKAKKQRPPTCMPG